MIPNEPNHDFLENLIPIEDQKKSIFKITYFKFNLILIMSDIFQVHISKMINQCKVSNANKFAIMMIWSTHAKYIWPNQKHMIPQIKISKTHKFIKNKFLLKFKNDFLQNISNWSQQARYKYLSRISVLRLKMIYPIKF